jgi:hypothetical protein
MTCALDELFFAERVSDSGAVYWEDARFCVVVTRKEVFIERKARTNPPVGQMFFCPDFQGMGHHAVWYHDIEPIALQCLLYNMRNPLTPEVTP